MLLYTQLWLHKSLWWLKFHYTTIWINSPWGVLSQSCIVNTQVLVSLIHPGPSHRGLKYIYNIFVVSSHVGSVILNFFTNHISHDKNQRFHKKWKGFEISDILIFHQIFTFLGGNIIRKIFSNCSMQWLIEVLGCVFVCLSK